MSEFSQVAREEIAVQFVRVPDGLEHIRRAWDELEAVVSLRGRHFYGAFDPVANDYRACVEVRDGDHLVPGLENGTLPGGRYLRARLHGEPPGVYERIGQTFDELTREAKPDLSRPSLEHYKRRDEIDLLLPVDDGA
jgi:Integron-associated effector binding protein